MSTFMTFAIGVLTGAVMGSIGMLLLIKETKLDDSLVTDLDDQEDITTHCRPAPAPELDWEELEQPQEVKYGNF